MYFQLIFVVYFYTFITVEGHAISLSGSHNIFVIAKGEKKVHAIRASKVTLNYQLIMAGRVVDINNIIYSQRTGFYSPLTLSSTLFVNNISTSVYVDQ